MAERIRFDHAPPANWSCAPTRTILLTGEGDGVQRDAICNHCLGIVEFTVRKAQPTGRHHAAQEAPRMVAQDLARALGLQSAPLLRRIIRKGNNF